MLLNHGRSKPLADLWRHREDLSAEIHETRACLLHDVANHLGIHFSSRARSDLLQRKHQHGYLLNHVETDSLHGWQPQHGHVAIQRMLPTGVALAT